MREELQRMYRLPAFDRTYAKNNGWFPAYRRWFEALGVDMAHSGADLDVVAQVVVTRNHAQHHDWIPNTSISYRGKVAEKFPRPFFGHEFDWERAAGKNGETKRIFPSLIKIHPEKMLQAIDEVDKLCEYVEREAWEIGRRRRSQQVQRS